MNFGFSDQDIQLLPITCAKTTPNRKTKNLQSEANEAILPLVSVATHVKMFKSFMSVYRVGWRVEAAES